jgi:beta-lactamase regulating signal transducer with metallopeptidase domain
MEQLSVVAGFVLSTAVKGALLVGVVALVIVLLRLRSAALRHAFWTLVVLAHLALPALAFLVPAVEVELPAWVPSGLLGGPVNRDDVAVTAPATGRTSSGRAVVGVGAVGGARRARTTVVAVPAVPAAPAAAAAPAVAAVAAAAPLPSLPRAARGGGPRLTAPRALAPRAFSGTRPARFAPVRDGGAGVPLSLILLGIWLAGAAIVLVRLGLGTVQVARLAHSGRPVIDSSWLALLHDVADRLDINRPVTLLRGSRLTVPVTWGVVYPIVLLPEDADTWDTERRRHVLVHELAHVTRLDALTQLLGQVATAIFWFDPAVWYAVHRMRVERERACDDVVLTEGAAPSRYAGDLLEMVRALEMLHRRATPAFATLAMARQHDFEGRMMSILDPAPDRRRLGTGGATVAMAAFALLMVPLSAVRAREAMPYADVAHGHASGHGGIARDLARASRATSVTVYGGGSASARRAAQVDSAVAALAAQMDRMLPARAALDTALAVWRAPVVSVGSLGDGSVSVASAAAPAVIGEALPTTIASTDCDVRTRGTGTSIHSNDDGGNDFTFAYTHHESGRCQRVVIDGRVTFNDDETDIASLARGASIEIEERVDGGDRRVFSAVSRANAFERSYTVNGRPAAFDADARSWLASMIQTVIREGGFGARERVARIRGEGGVPAVLAEIDRIHSTGARRRYYEALLDQGAIDDRDLSAIVKRVGPHLAGSSGDLSAVLTKLPVARLTSDAYDDLERSVNRIDSDGDKARVLMALTTARAEPRIYALALRAARGISSDGDKSRVLIDAAPRVFALGDESMLADYFHAAQTISSDGDKSRVLTRAIDGGRANETTTGTLIALARSISSDGDKSRVLVRIADAGLLANDALRDAYIEAARTISSDGDYRRAMERALRR